MATKKIDDKRELRELYAPGVEPLIVNAPELAYVMIDGHGDPNTTDEYGEAIQALYAVAYSAKFAVNGTVDGIDYAVMPREGLWSRGGIQHRQAPQLWRGTSRGARRSETTESVLRRCACDVASRRATPSAMSAAP